MHWLIFFFHWGPKQQKVFDNFKIAFTTAPILLHYNPNKQSMVKTDASDYVTAGVFSQYDDNGQLKPVVYFFCKMSFAECNYEMYDKEFLTTIKAFELWKSELENIEEPVQVIIDHRNLDYFISSKLLNRRQARWSEFFSRFNFKIIYRPNSLNNKTDAFTRQSGDILKKRDNPRQFQWQPVLKKNNLNIQQLTLKPIMDDEAFLKLFVTINDAILAAYSKDEKTQEILNALNTNQRTLKSFPLSESKLIGDRIYFRDKMFVPNVGQLKFCFIQKFHDDPAAGHPGKTKIYEILNRYYYWPGIINDVKRFVKNCYGCKKSKTFKNKYHGALKFLPVPDKKWAHISIDFIIDFPINSDLWGKDCINIMVMVNRLSKMVKCIPMDGITTKNAAKAFYIHVWKNNGLPKSIISDRKRPFVNNFWEQLTTRLRISADISTAYHPETDGQTEIMNSVLEQYLRAYINYFQNDWAFWLPSAEFAINNHASETTQCTPFLIDSGQHLKMGLEPDAFINKPMDLRERTDRDTANSFVEKLAEINEVLKKQMAFA